MVEYILYILENNKFNKYHNKLLQKSLKQINQFFEIN